MSFENSAFLCLVVINLIGIISAFALSNPGLKKKFCKMPKLFQKADVLIFFGAPILVLPLLPQPRVELHYIIFVIGIILALLSALVWILASKEIGIIPGVKQKSKVISSGIYSIIRHPIYLGNILMPLGLGLTFKATYALLYAPVIIIFFIITTFIEDKKLVEEYGKEYIEYKKKVKWRLVPWVL